MAASRVFTATYYRQPNHPKPPLLLIGLAFRYALYQNLPLNPFNIVQLYLTRLERKG